MTDVALFPRTELAKPLKSQRKNEDIIICALLKCLTRYKIR